MRESRFWEGVRHLLKKNRLTQETLAVAIGEESYAFRQRMKRPTSPEAELAVAIAKFLGTTVEELVQYGSESPVEMHSFGSRLGEGIAELGYSVAEFSDLTTVDESKIRRFLELTDPPHDVQALTLMVRHLKGGMDYFSLLASEKDDGLVEERKVLQRLRPAARKALIELATKWIDEPS